LLEKWRKTVEENRLEVRTGEGLVALKKTGNVFEVRTGQATYITPRVVLATGQRGNARKLAVPGEDRDTVFHRLYSPKHYRDEDILVIGGGNSAVEAVLALCEHNRVTLSYRGQEFIRVFKDNRRKLTAARESGQIKVIFRSR